MFFMIFMPHDFCDPTSSFRSPSKSDCLGLSLNSHGNSPNFSSLSDNIKMTVSEAQLFVFDPQTKVIIHHLAFSFFFLVGYSMRLAVEPEEESDEDVDFSARGSALPWRKTQGFRLWVLGVFSKD